MKKRIITFILVAVSFIGSAFAQVSLDPNDVFYRDAKNWETKGLVGWLPELRPYSIKTVKSILEQVKEKGDEKDVKLAEEYYDKYFGKSWNVGATVGNKLRLSDTEPVTDMLYFDPALYGDMELFKLVGMGYKLGIIFHNNNLREDAVLPLYHNREFYTYDDKANFGKIVGFINTALNFTVGTENLYGMAGINRLGFSPFLDDSVLLNGTQFHSGNFSLVVQKEKWSYVQTFNAISRAPKNSESSFKICMPDKFHALHSVRLTPNKYFSFSYFESSIIANRFDPCYLLPIPYMVLQGLYGAADNTVNGLMFDIKPIDRLRIGVATLFDDVDIEGLAKFNFNCRFKFSGQIGIEYVPQVSFIDNLTLDYTIVFPYTYGHGSPRRWPELVSNPAEYAKAYNETNYTNRLTSLGTRLPPNSDRIHFAATFRPVDRLRLDFATVFMRHANIAESFNNDEAQKYLDANAACTDGYYFATDGSIWTTSLTYPTNQQNNFMAQAHKMYVLQCAVDAEYELERQKWGRMFFNFGYMFEYIHNKGVDSDIFRDGSLTPAVARAQWVANLHNVFNNYFTVSVKYCY